MYNLVYQYNMFPYSYKLFNMGRMTVQAGRQTDSEIDIQTDTDASLVVILLVWNFCWGLGFC